MVGGAGATRVICQSQSGTPAFGSAFTRTRTISFLPGCATTSPKVGTPTGASSAQANTPSLLTQFKSSSDPESIGNRSSCDSSIAPDASVATDASCTKKASVSTGEAPADGEELQEGSTAMVTTAALPTKVIFIAASSPSPMMRHPSSHTRYG